MRLVDRLRDEHRSDKGATLVETLVALAILGVAAVAILAGLQMSVKASDIHRKQSTGGSAVRSYAEAIEKHLDTDGNYVPCAPAGTYAPAVVGYALPPGYTATQGEAVPLNGNGVAITSGCPGVDEGVQRLTLTVSSGDNRAAERLTIVVRRSCGSGTECP